MFSWGVLPTAQGGATLSNTELKLCSPFRLLRSGAVQCFKLTTWGGFSSLPTASLLFAVMLLASGMKASQLA